MGSKGPRETQKHDRPGRRGAAAGPGRRRGRARRLAAWVAAGVILAGAVFLATPRGRRAAGWVWARLAAGVPYPPGRVVLVGLKLERRLEVYAPGDDGAMRFIRSYPIVAASGRLGPKLANGDRQVPEGVYDVPSLNPNSAFHLSLRVGYPNAFDREMARRDGRTDLGGDIMIHGGDASIGCLAMGDAAAEDLFVLAAEAGRQNVRVLLSPVDFRRRELPTDRPAAPAWVEQLYADLRRELAHLPLPDKGR